MHERREVKRRHLFFHLRVFDRDSGEKLGHLVDITSDGVMLISETPIKTDIIYKLKMKLPAEVLGVEQLNFTAKSMWCKKDVNPDFYDTGFQITEASREHLAVVEKLIEEYGFRD